MRTFTINLLPPEFAREQKERQKFRKVQLVSVAAILILVFLSSTTAGLRFLQIRDIQEAEAQVQANEIKVSDLKDKEISLTVLKDKLTAIKTISAEPSKPTLLYDEVNQVLPGDIRITSMTVSSADRISISGVAPSANVLEAFLEGALSSASDEQGFPIIEIESLTRGREGVYRFSLNLITK